MQGRSTMRPTVDSTSRLPPLAPDDAPSLSIIGGPDRASARAATMGNLPVAVHVRRPLRRPGAGKVPCAPDSRVLPMVPILHRCGLGAGPSGQPTYEGNVMAVT